jgi:hypothetical protein
MTKIRSLALAVIVMGGFALAEAQAAQDHAGKATAGTMCPKNYCFRNGVGCIPCN